MSDKSVDHSDAELDERRQRNRRNAAIGLGLALFAALVFFVTILRLGGAVADRPF